MKKRLLSGMFCLLLLQVSLAQTPARLTVDHIMRDPKWMGTSPSEIAWSTDSKTVYFMWNPDKNKGDSLYRTSVADRRIEKVLPKERKILPSFAGSYTMDYSRRVFEKNGDIFLEFVNGGKVLQLTRTNEREYGPRFSLDEQSIVFQKGGNLFSFSLSDGALVQLTDFESGSKKAERKKTGQEGWLEKEQLNIFEVLKERKEKSEEAKKIAEESKPTLPKKIYLEDKRLTGLQVSPGEQFITYTLVESAKGAKATIVPNYVTLSGYTEDIPARTKVGSPAASYQSFIYHIKKDTVYPVVVKDLPGIYDVPDFIKEKTTKDTAKTKPVPRSVIVSEISWSPGGSAAVAVIRSADNKDRWIMKLDPETGKLSILDRQRDEAWIAGPGIGWAQGGGNTGWLDEKTFYFQSEQSGYSHLYTVNVLSGEKKQLTAGKYEILKAELSRDRKYFYLTTNELHPGEQHFYKMSVESGEKIRITTMTGAHEVTVSPDERLLAIRYSYINKPWELYIQKNEAGAAAEKVTTSSSSEFGAYPWREAKIVTIKARDGQEIYARLYEPAGKVKNKKAVIFVHGAGYLQNAHKWWSSYFREYMFHNLLVEKGYTVLDMDYRASAGYGRDVRTGIYRHMGGKDLTDNVDGADWLVKNHGIDAGKIGIYGGSYGGFITLMALFTTPDVFKAGAALRPVTDWAAYNHGYTANILNEPHTDSLAYRRSSPIYFADGLKNNLLICHGIVDVNVHYQDVVRLSQRLIELKKENWEMAGYPMEDHGFVEPSSWTDEYKRILRLFEEKLK